MAKKSTTTPAPVRWPQHKSGKYCGYDEYEDGSIAIADMHAAKMEEANTERLGLDTMVAAMQTHLSKQYTRIAALEKSFWNGVRNDYGLDYDAWECSYNHHTKRISKRPKPKPEDDKK